MMITSLPIRRTKVRWLLGQSHLPGHHSIVFVPQNQGKSCAVSRGRVISAPSMPGPFPYEKSGWEPIPAPRARGVPHPTTGERERASASVSPSSALSWPSSRHLVTIQRILGVVRSLGISTSSLFGTEVALAAD